MSLIREPSHLRAQSSDAHHMVPGKTCSYLTGFSFKQEITSNIHQIVQQLILNYGQIGKCTYNSDNWNSIFRQQLNEQAQSPSFLHMTHIKKIFSVRFHIICSVGAHRLEHVVLIDNDIWVPIFIQFSNELSTSSHLQRHQRFVAYHNQSSTITVAIPKSIKQFGKRTFIWQVVTSYLNWSFQAWFSHCMLVVKM